MKKCEVVVDAITIVVGKGSIVNVSEKQYELARAALKPIAAEQPKKPEIVERTAEVEIISEEKEEIKEKKRRKKAE